MQVASIRCQGDGNLVLYTAGGAPVWAIGTGGNRGKALSFQPDDNLVV